MDFNSLLKFETPFDQNKLDMIEKLLNILYTTINQEDVSIKLYNKI